MKHIIVLGAQVPFVRGGAELLNESLVREINKVEGLSAELVQLPFKWYPEEQMLNDIMAWRMLDLSESNGEKIDLVIATKFPTYAIEHHNKVLWLVHQYRQMYDLAFSEFDGSHWDQEASERSLKIRGKIKKLDNHFFCECKSIYTIAHTVSNRLMNFNKVDSTPLYPPAPLGDKVEAGVYGDYILHMGRLDKMKRIDLLIHAFALTKIGKLVITGKGPEYENLFQLIKEYNLEERCILTGFLDDEDLLSYLSNARAVYYAPRDEDYGYATIEGYLAKKPMITCFDSGEVTKIVELTGAGYVSESTKESIAANLEKIFLMEEKELEELAREGYKFTKNITWEKVIQNLVWENLK